MDQSPHKKSVTEDNMAQKKTTDTVHQHAVGPWAKNLTSLGLLYSVQFGGPHDSLKILQSAYICNLKGPIIHSAPWARNKPGLILPFHSDSSSTL